MSWLDRAIENTQEILEREAVEKLVLLMTAAAPCKGSGAVFRRIAQATSAETILDYSAEIRFGLVFKALRFEIEFEPLGRKGPDLKVSQDGQSTYVEVKRFRPSVADDGPTVGIGGELMPYGNLEKTVKRIEDELAKKFSQVEADSGIVAFWSDHSTVEAIDFELAIRHMRSDGETGVRQVPDGILLSIFASGWMSAIGQQLYCEALKPLSEPFSTWVHDLKRFSMP
jgi:hypothetical protein